MADVLLAAEPPAKRVRLDACVNVASLIVLDGEEEPAVTTAELAEVSDGDPMKERGAGYDAISRRNDRFEQYYRTIGNVPESEWHDFMATIREPLPSSFRITGFRSEAEAMKNIIQENYVSKLTDGFETLAKPLKFYPRNLAYQLDMSKRELRRCDPLVEFRQFLVAEDGCGNVSRQETVSMLPPILLQVRPGHKVLDMCAAPGSKTGQIIEMLHTDMFESSGSSNGDANTSGETALTSSASTATDKERAEDLIRTDGLVIANDADYKRCHLLNHQMKRLHTPCLIISNHDAAQFPNIRLSSTDSTGGTISTILAFDRILCDVPCSGDGTIRKSLDMWRRWTPAFALGLHYRQFLILKRGLELLAVGGRLVYSTCSMNPVENEAVIARALKLCGGDECVRLVDCRAYIECGGDGLRTMPGLASWPIADDAGNVYKKFADVPVYLQRGKIQADMFPPIPKSTVAATDGAASTAGDADDPLHLRRCIRILPHHNNTGGFFVAVMEKLRPLPWQRQSASSSAAGGAVPVRLKGPKGFREEPFNRWTAEEPTDWEQVQKFYGVAESFPVHTQCFVRVGSHKTRNVFLVTDNVQRILTENRDKLQVCATGVRILSRSGTNLEDKVRYRLVQEGIHVWLPLLGVNVVQVSGEDVRLLLTEDNPLFEHFSDDAQRQVKPMPEGSVVTVHKGKFGLSIQLIAWRATCTLKCFIPQKDREHFLRLLNETSAM